MTTEERKRLVYGATARITEELNSALTGRTTDQYRGILGRIGRGGRVPHWFDVLAERGELPNLDGKTIGSVVEMLLLAVIETHVLTEDPRVELRVNPARGVDLPDLDLGVKSPSTNWCTSEPFFSAYERLVGSAHDALVLLTDYQTKKKFPPLRLSVLSVRYLSASEIADKKLCSVARGFRRTMVDVLGSDFEFRFKMLCQFLAYVNQSDWRARHLIEMAKVVHAPELILAKVLAAERDFASKNRQAEELDEVGIPTSELEAIQSIRGFNPVHLGVIDALTRWVSDAIQDAARLPTAIEWEMLKNGDLNGQIGMSFALQWRYNFRAIFPGLRRGH